MPFATTEGVRLHYELEGNGPPLVLHHGISQTHRRWYECGYVDALSQSYRLILLDALGHGESDRPTDPAAYESERRVGQVLAVMDAEDVEKAHFFGYSAGGRVGFALAKYAPERFHSFIIGGAHPYSHGPPRDDESRRMRWGRRGGRVLGMLGPLRRPALRLAVEAATRVRGRRRRGTLRAGAIMMLVGASLDRTYRDDLPRMACPTLLFVGELEQGFDPGLAKHAAESMPNASFELLPGLDHGSALCESAVTLPHVTRFLEQHAEAARAAG